MLKGIHKTSKKLADGSRRDYYYAWKGGPRLAGGPGSPEFITSHAEAIKTRTQIHKGTLSGLIVDFRQSTEFTNLAKLTRRDYMAMFDLINAEFGDMPIEALDDRRVRKLFKDWRDGFASTPRKADRAWSTLKRIFSIAMDNGVLDWNPCNRGGKMYHGTRKNIIWTQAEIDLFTATAPGHIVRPFLFALHTGQRQGDILRLQWSNFDGTHINLKQSKTGRQVSVLAHSQLLRVLIEIPKTSTTILTSTKGTPWTSHGFQTSWKRALKKAGVEGKTFHDLKGTFITRARRNGSSIEDIAQVTGNSTKDVRSVLEKHYIADSSHVADGVILRMEKHKK